MVELLSDEERQNIKRKVIDRLNQKYDMIEKEVRQVRDDKLDELDFVAQAQMYSNNDVSNESLTIRKALELEKDGTTEFG